jgi:hypothetical protein
MSSPSANNAAPPARWHRWAWFAGGCLVGLIGLNTVLWWMATDRMLAAVQAAAPSAGQGGWRIETGAASRGGWPFEATLRFPATTVTRPLGSATFRWTAEAVEVTLSPAHPRMVAISPQGAQVFDLGGSSVGVRASLAELRVPLAGGASLLDWRDVAVGRPGEADQGLHMARLAGEMDGLTGGATADGVTISPALAAPFDGPLAVSGGIRLNVGFPDAPTPGASALAWQQAGGRIDVPALTLRWGPLTIAGTAQIGLDGQVQPTGQARLQVTGAAEVLDALGRARLLPPGQAAAARAVLGLLAIAAHGGPVPIGVTLADRTLSVAQFPLLRLPPVDWDVH